MIVKLSHGSSLNGYFALGIASMIGIIGNSLTTFSKRINSNRGYYVYQSKITNYTYIRYLIDQTLLQFVLNGLIFAVMVCIGLIMGVISLNSKTFIIGGLALLLGLYFSTIGFSLGFNFKPLTLENIGFPTIILGALTIVPFYLYRNGNSFINLILKVQKLFPGYYFTRLINNLLSGNSLGHLFLMFLFTGFVTMLVIDFGLFTLSKSNK